MLGIALTLLATGNAGHGRTIEFSGYTWIVRSAGRGGPGPNDWAPDNVSIDTQGYLHLRLAHREGKWYCAELQTQERLGFGRYEFSLTGPVDNLDANVVLGLFNYPTSDVGPDGTHEIDIEFARWGNPSAPTGNYTVWPVTNRVSRQSKSFAFRLAGDSSKHSFTWSPTNIVFKSQDDHSDAELRQFANWSYQPSDSDARIAQKAMPVHINLWCFKGQPPSDAKEVEIIVRAFKFTPL